MLFADRIGYHHVGIDLGDGTVIHFTGEPSDVDAADIQQTTLDDFRNNSSVAAIDPAARLGRDITCILAHTHVGRAQGMYDPFVDNCESFASFCCTGVWASAQVYSVLEASMSERSLGDGLAALAHELIGRWVERRDHERRHGRIGRRKPAPVELDYATLYYYGELYRGLKGKYHTRCDVLGTGTECPIEERWELPGSWLKGPPWSPQLKTRSGLDGIGFGCLGTEQLAARGCAIDWGSVQMGFG